MNRCGFINGYLIKLVLFSDPEASENGLSWQFFLAGEPGFTKLLLILPEVEFLVKSHSPTVYSPQENTDKKVKNDYLLRDDDGVHQATTPHRFDHIRWQLGQFLSQNGSKLVVKGKIERYFWYKELFE